MSELADIREDRLILQWGTEMAVEGTSDPDPLSG